MANPAAFWDRMAARYASQPIADLASYEKKLAVTREYLRPDMEVLEFGCGTGSTAILHAPYVNHIHAIDISSKMLEIAQRKAIAADITNLTFTRAGIDEWDMRDPSYDAVLGLSILHLLRDKDAVIAKVHRMLKPDGVFVTSTACIRDMSLPRQLLAGVIRLVRFVPNLAVFSETELVASLVDAGFEPDYRWRPGRNKAVFIVARKVTAARVG
jgi:ubiquinone/menaquinone biosynthesis C-methylase UbiE